MSIRDEALVTGIVGKIGWTEAPTLPTRWEEHQGGGQSVADAYMQPKCRRCSEIRQGCQIAAGAQ